ncbi:MAG: Ig-like domain-containing protein, partial [Muribaculaceae bacterium]|nr:Ig-like domain-containing protein [Muribaculaceae bacterium]
ICLTAGAMACALTACDDDKQLTLDGNEVKLMNEITFDLSSTLPLPVGMDTTISYTYGPMDAVTSTIVFSSSDESVAKVDQNGKITGIGVGEATILARPEGFDYKVYDAEASVLVKVIEKLIPVEKIILTNITPVTSEDGKIFVTDEFQLSAEILPADHTYSRLVWGTTNADVATVDQTGKVVCTGEGDVTIYAIATDRTGVTGEYKLHVDRYIAAEKVTIKPLDGPTRLYAGTVTLDVVYDPVGATVGSVDWMSDNESVATVRRGVVTPVGFGTANIIATCVETGYQTSIPVTVEAGWFIWDASNQWNPWIVSDYNNHILRDERGDKVWRLYFKVPAAGGKWRGDIKVNCSTSNLFNMSLANYPVLAVRMTKMNGGNSTL